MSNLATPFRSVMALTVRVPASTVNPGYGWEAWTPTWVSEQPEKSKVTVTSGITSGTQFRIVTVNRPAGSATPPAAPTSRMQLDDLVELLHWAFASTASSDTAQMDSRADTIHGERKSASFGRRWREGFPL